eukprot:14275395-Alexandrium_andersonii.AAC.1
MVRRPSWAQTPSPKLSRGPFCAVVRAEREYGSEDLPRVPESSCGVGIRTGRGSGIENAGNDGRINI